jgi:hypothetical protein
MTGTLSNDSYMSFLTAQSLVEKGSLAVDEHDLSNDANLSHRGYLAERGVKNPEGRYYSKYGIGWALLMIPFYLFGKSVAVLFSSVNPGMIELFMVCTLGPILMAFLLTILYRFIVQMGLTEKNAILTVVVCSFGTMIPFYGRGPYVEVLDSILMLLIVHQLYLFSIKKGGGGCLFRAGWMTALMVTTKTYNAVIVFPILAWMILIIRSRKIPTGEYLKGIAFFIVPIAAALFAVLIMNKICWGSFVRTGYENEIRQGWLSIYRIPEGIMGLLTSPGASIVLYNPCLLFAFYSMTYVLKKKKEIAWAILFMFFSFLLFISAYANWYSGPWGPRYLVPVVTLLMLSVPFGMDTVTRLRNKLHAPVLVVLFALGFLINLPSLLVDVNKWSLLSRNTKVFSGQESIDNPKFSPVIGGWHLLISSCQSTLKGASLTLAYNEQDARSATIGERDGDRNRISLSAYDESDIWFLRVLKGKVTKYDGTIAVLPIRGKLKALCIAIVILLASVAALSCYLYAKMGGRLQTCQVVK